MKEIYKNSENLAPHYTGPHTVESCVISTLLLSLFFLCSPVSLNCPLFVPFTVPFIIYLISFLINSSKLSKSRAVRILFPTLGAE